MSLYDLIRIRDFIALRLPRLQDFCFRLTQRLGRQYNIALLPGPTDFDRSLQLVQVAEQQGQIGELVYYLVYHWVEDLGSSKAMVVESGLHHDLIAYWHVLQEKNEAEKLEKVSALLAKIDPKLIPQVPPPPAASSITDVVGKGPFDVFLSYSRSNTTEMEQVYAELVASGFKVWVDQTGIPLGTPEWSLAIEQGIIEAACVVVLLSPAARNSKWVRAELNFAAAQEKKVFPILVEGTEQNALPLEYIRAQWFDLRGVADYTGKLGQLIAAIRTLLGV